MCRFQLAFLIGTAKIVDMAKVTKSSKSSRSGTYKVAGRTSDGVFILAPKAKPTHFTAREMRSTITEVRRDSKSGRYMVRSKKDPHPSKG